MYVLTSWQRWFAARGQGDHDQYQKTNDHFHQKQQKQRFGGREGRGCSLPSKKTRIVSDYPLQES